MGFDFDGYYNDFKKQVPSMKADTIAQMAMYQLGRANPDDTVDTWAEREGFAESLNKHRETERQSVLAEERDRNVEETSSLMRGLKSGVDKTQALLYGAAGLAGDAVGLDGVRDWGLKGYQRNMEEASLNPSKAGSFRELLNDPSLENSFDYVGHTLGDLLPTMASMAVGSPVLGAGMKVAGKAALKRVVGQEMVERVGTKMTQRMTGKMIENGVAKETAQAIASKTLQNRGGLVATSALIESGGMYGDSVEHLSQKYQTQGLNPDEAMKQALEDVSVGSAAGLGLAAGMVELAGGNMRMFDKLWGTGVRETINTAMRAAKKSPNLRAKTLNIVRDVLVEAAKEAPGEFGQEAAQEALALANLNFNDPEFELISSDSAWQMFESGIAGMIGGVAGGAAHTAADAIPGRKAKDFKDQVSQLQTRIANQEDMLRKDPENERVKASLERNKKALADAETSMSADKDRLTFAEAATLLNKQAPALSGKPTTNKAIKKLVESGKLKTDEDGFVTKDSAEGFTQTRSARRMTKGGKVVDVADLIDRKAGTEVDLVEPDETGRHQVARKRVGVRDGEVGYLDDAEDFRPMSPEQLRRAVEVFQDVSQAEEEAGQSVEKLAPAVAKILGKENVSRSEVESTVTAVLNGEEIEGVGKVSPRQLGLENAGLGKGRAKAIYTMASERKDGERLDLKTVLEQSGQEEQKKNLDKKRQNAEKERLETATTRLMGRAESELGEGAVDNPEAVKARAAALLRNAEALQESGFTEQDIADMGDAEDLSQALANIRDADDLGGVRVIGDVVLPAQEETPMEETERRIAGKLDPMEQAEVAEAKSVDPQVLSEANEKGSQVEPMEIHEADADAKFQAELEKEAEAGPESEKEDPRELVEAPREEVDDFFGDDEEWKPRVTETGNFGREKSTAPIYDPLQDEVYTEEEATAIWETVGEVIKKAGKGQPKTPIELVKAVSPKLAKLEAAGKLKSETVDRYFEDLDFMDEMAFADHLDTFVDTKQEQKSKARASRRRGFDPKGEAAKATGQVPKKPEDMGGKMPTEIASKNDSSFKPDDKKAPAEPVQAQNITGLLGALKRQRSRKYAAETGPKRSLFARLVNKLAGRVVPTRDDMQKQFMTELNSWEGSELPASKRLQGQAAKSPLAAILAGRRTMVTLPKYRSQGYGKGQIFEIKTSGKSSHFVRITGVVPVSRLSPSRWAQASGLDGSDAGKVKAAYANVSGEQAVFFRPLRDGEGNVITSKEKLEVAEPVYVGDVSNLSIKRHKGKRTGKEHDGFPGVVKHNVDNAGAVVIISERQGDSDDKGKALARARAKARNIPVFDLFLDGQGDVLSTLASEAKGRPVNIIGPSSFGRDFGFAEQAEADQAVSEFWDRVRLEGTGRSRELFSRELQVLAIGQEGIEEAFLRGHLSHGGLVSVHTVDWSEKDQDTTFRLAGVPEAVMEAKQARREAERTAEAADLTTALIQAEIRGWAKEGTETPLEAYRKLRDHKLKNDEFSLKKNYPPSESLSAREAEVLDQIAKAIVLEHGMTVTGVKLKKGGTSSSAPAHLKVVGPAPGEEVLTVEAIKSPKIKFIGKPKDAAAQDARIKEARTALEELVKAGYMSFKGSPLSSKIKGWKGQGYRKRFNMFLAGFPDLLSDAAGAGSNTEISMRTDLGMGGTTEILTRHEQVKKMLDLAWKEKMDPATLEVLTPVWGLVGGHHAKMNVFTSQADSITRKAMAEAPVTAEGLPSIPFPAFWSVLRRKRDQAARNEAAAKEAGQHVENRLLQLYDLVKRSRDGEWLSAEQIAAGQEIMTEVFDAAGVPERLRPDMTGDNATVEGVAKGSKFRLPDSQEVRTSLGVVTGQDVLGQMKNKFLGDQIAREEKRTFLEANRDKPVGVLTEQTLTDFSTGKKMKAKELMPLDTAVEGQVNFANLFPLETKWKENSDGTRSPIVKPKSSDDLKSPVLNFAKDLLLEAKKAELLAKNKTAPVAGSEYRLAVDEKTGELILTAWKTSRDGRMQSFRIDPASLEGSHVEKAVKETLGTLEERPLELESYSALFDTIEKTLEDNGISFDSPRLFEVALRNLAVADVTVDEASKANALIQGWLSRLGEGKRGLLADELRALIPEETREEPTELQEIWQEVFKEETEENLQEGFSQATGNKGDAENEAGEADDAMIQGGAARIEDAVAAKGEEDAALDSLLDQVSPEGLKDFVAGKESTEWEVLAAEGRNVFVPKKSIGFLSTENKAPGFKVRVGSDSTGRTVGSMGPDNMAALADYVVKGGKVVLSNGEVFRKDHALAVRAWAAMNKPLRFIPDATPGFRADTTVRQILKSIGLESLPVNLASMETKKRNALLTRLTQEQETSGSYLAYAIGLDENDALFAQGLNAHAVGQFVSAQQRAMVKRSNKWQSGLEEIGEVVRVTQREYDEIAADMESVGQEGWAKEGLTVEEFGTPEDASYANIAKVIGGDKSLPMALGSRMLLVTYPKGKIVTYVQKTVQQEEQDLLNANSDAEELDGGRVISKLDLKILADNGQIRSVKGRSGNSNRKPTASAIIDGKQETVSIDMSSDEITLAKAELKNLEQAKRDLEFLEKRFGVGAMLPDSGSEVVARHMMYRDAGWLFKPSAEAKTGNVLTELVEPAEIQGQMQEVANQLAHAGATPVQVFFGLSSAPASVRAWAKKKLKKGQQLNGLTGPDGTVYLLLDAHADKNGNLDRKQLTKTLFHEVAGHKGLSGVLGEKYDAFLGEAYSVFKEEIGAVGNEKARRSATEEFLARMLEEVSFDEKTGTFKSHKAGTILDKLISLVMKSVRGVARVFGREIGLTRAEVRTMLFDAYSGVRMQRAFGMAGIVPAGLIARNNLPGMDRFGSYEENVTDMLLRKLENDFRPMESYQKSMERSGRTISEEDDVALHKSLMSGRVGTLLNSVDDTQKEYESKLRNLALSHNDVASFMAARHAEERNAALQAEAKKWFIDLFEREGMHQDESREDREKIAHGDAWKWVLKNTNMTNKQAREAMEKFRAEGLVNWEVKDGETTPTYSGKMAEVAAIVDGLNTRTMQLAVDYGFQTQQDVDNMNKAFKYFVPGGPEETEVGKEPGSKGSTASRTAKHLTMREQGGVDPVAMSFVRLKRTIVKGEKNLVYQSLMNLVENHPNASVFEIWSPGHVIKAMNKAGKAPDKLWDEGRFEIKKIEVGAEDDVYTLENGYIPVWKDGIMHYVRAKHKRLAAALTRVDRSEANKITKALGKVNRWLIMTNTMLNPEFAFWANPLRDIGTATGNTALMKQLGREGANASSKEVARAVPRAINTLLHLHAKGLSVGQPDAEMVRYAKEFEAAGGKVGMPYIGNPEQVAESLKKNARKRGSQGGFVSMLADGGKSVAETMIGATEAVENGTRLAFYVTARKAGLSEKRAANLARELTVDFNKRGEFGQVMNSMYLFSNAGVQGTMRIFRGIKDNPQKAVKMLGGVVAASFMIAEMARFGAGDDDKGENRYESIDRSTRNNHIVLMWPGMSEGLKVPVPYGYGFFWSMGQKMSEIAHGEIDSLDGAAGLLDSMLNNFNPLGGAGELRTSHDWIRTATPTLADPFIDILFEKTPFGTPLMPEKRVMDQPDSQRYWNTVNPVSKAATRWINEMTGGTGSTSGLVDVSPETFDLLFREFVGGSGAFLARVGNYAAMQVNGVTPRWNEVPMARRMVAAPQPFMLKSQMRDAMNMLQAVKNRGRHLENMVQSAQDTGLKKQRMQDLKEFRSKYSEMLGYKKRADKIYSQIKRVDKQQSRWINSGLPEYEIRRKLQELGRPQGEIMRSFLKDYHQMADRLQ